jgi:hypothetical protein
VTWFFSTETVQLIFCLFSRNFFSASAFLLISHLHRISFHSIFSLIPFVWYLTKNKTHHKKIEIIIFFLPDPSWGAALSQTAAFGSFAGNFPFTNPFYQPFSLLTLPTYIGTVGKHIRIQC